MPRIDCWFKHWVQEVTGADLNAPPLGPNSEIFAERAP